MSEKKSQRPTTGRRVNASVEQAGKNRPTPPKKDKKED